MFYMTVILLKNEIKLLQLYGYSKTIFFLLVIKYPEENQNTCLMMHVQKTCRISLEFNLKYTPVFSHWPFGTKILIPCLKKT